MYTMFRRNQNFVDILRLLSLGEKQLGAFDISLRFTHLFWCGDLNYRLDLDVQVGPTVFLSLLFTALFFFFNIVFWFSTIKDCLNITCGIWRNPRHWCYCFFVALTDSRTSWNMYLRESLKSSCVQTSWRARDTRGRPFSISVSFSLLLAFVWLQISDSYCISTLMLFCNYKINDKSIQYHLIMIRLYLCLSHSVPFLCLSRLRGREDRISTHLSVWTGLKGLLPVAKVQDFRSESLLVTQKHLRKTGWCVHKKFFQAQDRGCMPTIKTISAPLSSGQKMFGSF